MPLIDLLENTSVCILHLFVHKFSFVWVFSLFASPAESLSGAGVLCCCIVFIKKLGNNFLLHTSGHFLPHLITPLTCINRCIVMFTAAVHTIIYNTKNVHSYMTSQSQKLKAAKDALYSCISWRSVKWDRPCWPDIFCLQMWTSEGPPPELGHSKRLIRV